MNLSWRQVWGSCTQSGSSVGILGVSARGTSMVPRSLGQKYKHVTEAEFSRAPHSDVADRGMQQYYGPGHDMV